MKIVVVGDLHLISENDPFKSLHELRGFFKSAWPSFKVLQQKINDESPDLIVCLGDLVDWYSDENADFAADLLQGFKNKPMVVAGNHDYCEPMGGVDTDQYRTSASRPLQGEWLSRGIDFSNQYLSAEQLGLVFMDNALSDCSAATKAWLKSELDGKKTDILFSHVPLDFEEVREAILNVDANRDLGKYVMSKAPTVYSDFFPEGLKEQYCGHLHFHANVTHADMRIQICNMGISTYDSNRDKTMDQAYTVINLDNGTIKSEIKPQ